MNRIAELLKEDGADIVEAMQTLFVQYKINATGNLSRNTLYQVFENPKGTQLIVTSLAYIYTIDTGRGVTKNRTGDFKVQDIVTWLVAKRITPKKGTLEQMAYAVWKSINEKGTRTYRNGGRDILNASFQSAFADLEKKLADAIFKETLIVIEGANSYFKP
jgi:hypothetical protein